MAFPALSGSDFPRDSETGSFLSAAVGWLGAGVSCALVVGLVWWAYDIATRDSRTVPVIRAMDGPARIAPDDPGGFQAPHTGYAVNAIAGEKPREPVADAVALAPKPAAIEESDKPALRPGSAPPEDVIRSSVDRALMDALGLEAAPAETEASAPATGGILRPQLRPAMADVSRSQSDLVVPVAAVAASPSALPAGDIPAGTRLVQLGAFSSEAAAAQEWARLTGQFAEYFSDKRPVYEQSDAAGTSVWRLRAHGFEDRAEARRFCEVLLAARAECIPVLTR